MNLKITYQKFHQNIQGGQWVKCTRMLNQVIIDNEMMGFYKGMFHAVSIGLLTYPRPSRWWIGTLSCDAWLDSYAAQLTNWPLEDLNDNVDKWFDKLFFLISLEIGDYLRYLL